MQGDDVEDYDVGEDEEEDENGENEERTILRMMRLRRVMWRNMMNWKTMNLVCAENEVEVFGGS